MVTQTRKVATVFGGAGFIGRYLVPHLVRQGYVIRIAGRDPERGALLKPLGTTGQIVPLYAPVTDAAAIGRAVDGADIVVNLVGIVAERRAGDFADAAARAGVRHLVHVSAIGASGTSRSGYARGKAAGEAAVTAGFRDAVILRPSIVFGAEDQFFNRFGEMARLSPVMPLISGGTKFQPVYVGDVAEAIVAALALPLEAPRVYELGGPKTWTFREILTYILKETRRNRPLVAIPPGIARLQARILERLPGKLLTTDQLEMLGQDNVVSGTLPGLAAFGITPKPVELIVPSYLLRYADRRKTA
jgi:uncharacterized protein YbjT (DUF2867 family)